MSPWGTLFDNCNVSETFTIKSTEAAGVHPPVVLSPLDQTAVVTFVSISGILVYPQEIGVGILANASRNLAAKYPILAGRIHADKKMLEIECSNEGFPLTVGDWPEGSVESFPEALNFQDWPATGPCRLPPPFFVDELNGFQAAFKKQPLFKLRLTRLGGDGGCILAATASHVVGGGAQIARLLVDLASACRGEPLQPLPKGLSRSLFTPSGLGEAVPFLKPVLEEAVAASLSQEEERENNFEEAWNRNFGGQEDCNIPFWPTNSFGDSIASVMLLLSRRDLGELKERASAAHKGLTFSTNDILVGLNWVLRCIVEDAPLPGQPGTEADFGFTSINIATNSFPEITEHYFGNTTTAFMVKLPAAGAANDGGTASQGGKGEDDLFEAVCRVAIANRNALNKWRSGSDLLPFLQRLTALDRLEKEKQTIAQAKQAGACVRSLHTNMLFLASLVENNWAKVDCGTGGAKHAFVFFDRVTKFSTIMPGAKGGALWQAFLPGNYKKKLDESKFLEVLLPNSKLVA